MEWTQTVPRHKNEMMAKLTSRMTHFHEDILCSRYRPCWFRRVGVRYSLWRPNSPRFYNELT